MNKKLAEMKIELDAPNIGKREKEYLNRVIDSGFVSTVGPFVSQFEEDFARYLNVEKAVAIQSGTEALHMALYELGITAGDEVILPALTFVASASPILYVGATPVFVDVDRKTWNIDPDEIEKSITKRTKAIMPVHFYGNPCDMDRIMSIAKKHNLFVIEDATESLGAKYRGQFTGTFGQMGCFSFNGNKTVTAGGGGMVVGKDADQLAHIKFLINQARDESKGYYHPEVGFNYRMTNVAAALGLAQMGRLNEFLEKKRTFNRIYRKELRDIEGISFQEEEAGNESSWWFSCVTFGKEIDIPALQKTLKEKGVPTRRIFTPVVEFPPYEKYLNADCKNSYDIYERSLCLPCSTLNSEDQIYAVCEILKEEVRSSSL